MNSLGSDERVFRELLTRFFTGKSALANATWAPRIDTLETIVRHDATIARWGAVHVSGVAAPLADSTIIPMYSPLRGSPVRAAAELARRANLLAGTRSRYDGLAGSQRVTKELVNQRRQASRSVCV
jgi:hypothetical protein